jgi:acetyl esterase/lipase
MKRGLIGLGILLIVAGWSFSASAGAEGTAVVKSGGSFNVRVVQDLAYYTGPDADPVKHKLDLYLPEGQKDFPVLLFVHGGAWRHGDKKYLFDVYGNIGRVFARNGIAAVVTNYRLSPKVQHPKHVEDVAKAFAWTHRHIGEYSGRADQIFISGHSAGGHLVALLATDEQYLKAEKLSITHVKGVISLSGVYEIPSGKLFRSAFGEDDSVRRNASPLEHVNGKHPPFLVLYGDKDFPTCDRVSEAFCRALQKTKCEATSCEIKERDHLSIIVKLGKEEDPAAQKILEFIAKHSDLKLTEKKVELP